MQKGERPDDGRQGQSDLANIMMRKSATGLRFGVVLEALRLKTRYCYSMAMLLHGALNVFAS